MDSVFMLLQGLNDNKIMWGISMIMLNMGSKYVIGDLGKNHEKIMNNEWVKKIILLFMFFMATRDIVTSFMLAVLYIIIVDGMLHEKRNFSLFSLDTTSTVNRAQESFQDTYDRYLQNINMLHKFTS